MELTPFTLAGTVIAGAGFVLMAIAMVWQIVLAFKSGVFWGILSVLGLLCFFLIPNLVWVIANWKDGWRPLAAYFAAIPIMLVGYVIVLMDTAVAMTGG